MSEAISTAPSISGAISRRADLDALRAFAMLLGIALHASHSFTPMPWMVQDTRQHAWFGTFSGAVHGFRMPLFFVVSGFFTAMLWRRRGLIALLKQRTLRIFLPCMLGLVSVIPAMNRVSEWAQRSAIKPFSDDGTLVAAIRQADRDAVRQRLDSGANVNEPDPDNGVTPLNWAAMRGDIEIVQLLVDRGADVNGKNRQPDGSTPLHGAAFVGQPEVAAMLIEHGAVPDAPNQGGDTPLKAASADWDVTEAIVARYLQLPLGSKADVTHGRDQVKQILGQHVQATVDKHPAGKNPGEPNAAPTLPAKYAGFLFSDRFDLTLGGESIHLVKTPVFHHLWFLWFLCWLVPIFALTTLAAERWSWPRVPRWLILSPARFLWLIPITLIPEFLMGYGGPHFGPDTSVGLVVPPHLILYYGIFFGFGALYFDAGDDDGRLGRWWWLLLPAAILLAFPAGLMTMGNRVINPVLQVVFAWTMSIGLMGLFRQLLQRERTVIRYLSDSSYWLYIVHLPLVIAGQVVVREWPLPPLAKFFLIYAVVTGFLLATYQLLVRHTWIGLIMNGPRPRGQPIR